MAVTLSKIPVSWLAAMRIHDGDTFKVGRDCYAEFVDKNQVHQEAFRIMTKFGQGVCIEGLEIDELIRVLQLSRESSDS